MAAPPPHRCHFISNINYTTRWEGEEWSLQRLTAGSMSRQPPNHSSSSAVSILAIRYLAKKMSNMWWENIKLCLIIIIKSEVWTITHCLGLGHETMVCAVCLSILLWICDMAVLLRGTFVSWWYLPRIWPSDMQHYYHARYPTDNWHLAYMFSLVYFSVEVCLEGVFPHSVSTKRDLCVRVYAPSRCPPHVKKSNREWASSPLEPSKGAFELTRGSACIIGWWSGLPDSLISTYIT